MRYVYRKTKISNYYVNKGNRILISLRKQRRARRGSGQVCGKGAGKQAEKFLQKETAVQEIKGKMLIYFVVCLKK